MIEGSLQLRVLGDIVSDLLETLARRTEALLELSFGLYFGFSKSHLHTAMGVDLSFARGFDRQENHVLEFVDDGGLDSIGLRRRHAPERFQRQHHVAPLMYRVVDVLAYLKVPFTTARELVVEGMRERREALVVKTFRYRE